MFLKNIFGADITIITAMLKLAVSHITAGKTQLNSTGSKTLFGSDFAAVTF